MKKELFLLGALSLAGVQGADARVAGPTSAYVVAFVKHPTHCAVMLGGLGRSQDSADPVYASALAKALTDMGGSVPRAIERMKTACSKRGATFVDRPMATSEPRRDRVSNVHRED